MTKIVSYRISGRVVDFVASRTRLVEVAEKLVPVLVPAADGTPCT